MLLAAPERTPQLPMALGVAASATQHPASTTELTADINTLGHDGLILLA